MLAETQEASSADNVVGNLLEDCSNEVGGLGIEEGICGIANLLLGEGRNTIESGDCLIIGVPSALAPVGLLEIREEES